MVVLLLELMFSSWWVVRIVGVFGCWLRMFCIQVMVCFDGSQFKVSMRNLWLLVLKIWQLLKLVLLVFWKVVKLVVCKDVGKCCRKGFVVRLCWLFYWLLLSILWLLVRMLYGVFVLVFSICIVLWVVIYLLFWWGRLIIFFRCRVNLIFLFWQWLVIYWVWVVQCFGEQCEYFWVLGIIVMVKVLVLLLLLLLFGGVMVDGLELLLLLQVVRNRYNKKLSLVVYYWG